MNITNNSAGYVSDEHIKSKGFKVFDVIEINDMGQTTYSLQQFKNDKFQIIGGYWNYVIKDLNGNKLWDGWWNSNEEFDETITKLTNEEQANT